MIATTLPGPTAEHHAAPAPTASAPEPTQTPATAPQAPAAEGAADQGSAALLAAVASGAVALYRRRGTGTLRRLPYLAPGTPAREAANWYALRLDQGASVANIAGEAQVSRANVRRALAALDLAEAVEDGDLDDLYAEGTDALVFGADEDEQ